MKSADGCELKRKSKFYYIDQYHGYKISKCIITLVDKSWACATTYEKIPKQITLRRGTIYKIYKNKDLAKKYSLRKLRSKLNKIKNCIENLENT